MKRERKREEQSSESDHFVVGRLEVELGKAMEGHRLLTLS